MYGYMLNRHQTDRLKDGHPETTTMWGLEKDMVVTFFECSAA